MKKEKTYRIDGFEQINAFYNWIFENPDKAKPNHISLYFFLFSVANQVKWEPFRCSYYTAMKGSRIGNNGTYYKCLEDLCEWGLIEYTKGINNYAAPLINLIRLFNTEQVTTKQVFNTEQVTAQQVFNTEQVTAQQMFNSEQVTAQCLFKTEHIYSNNNNIITNNNNNSNIENSPPQTFSDDSLLIENDKSDSQPESEAEKLFQEVINLFPLELQPKTQKQKSEWIDTIEKLLRIDNQTPDEISKVIRSARSDDFWAKNFLSVLKLRKKNKEGVCYYQVFQQLGKRGADGRFKKVNDLWEKDSSNAMPHKEPVKEDPFLRISPEAKKLVGWFMSGYLPSDKNERIFNEASIPQDDNQKLRWLQSIDNITRVTGYRIVEIQNAVIHARTDQFWKNHIQDLCMIEQPGPDGRELIHWLIADMQNKKQGYEKSENEKNKLIKHFNKQQIHAENLLNVSFENFWNLYDKKRGDTSRLEKVWNELTDSDRLQIMEYIPKYIRSTPNKAFRKDPQTFLDNRSWMDEIISSSENININPNSSHLRIANDSSY